MIDADPAVGYRWHRCADAAEALRRFANENGSILTAEPIINRLLTHKEAGAAWVELKKMRRPRPSSEFPTVEETFFYATILTPDQLGIITYDPLEIQDAALALLFERVWWFAFSKFSTEPLSYVQTYNQSIALAIERENAQLKFYTDTHFGNEVIASEGRIRRLQLFLKSEISKEKSNRKLKLLSERSTGDPKARGIAIATAEMCRIIFGKPMDKISQTLASVAIDAKTSRQRNRPIASQKGR